MILVKLHRLILKIYRKIKTKIIRPIFRNFIYRSFLRNLIFRKLKYGYQRSKNYSFWKVKRELHRYKQFRNKRKMKCS